jgi:hypothetical protein
MSRTSRREYLLAIGTRYRRVGGVHRGKLLDEFCRVCGYARKYAIRLLAQDPHRRRRRKGPGSLRFQAGGQGEDIVLAGE